jgi:circadian clock protein KaiC
VISGGERNRTVSIIKSRGMAHSNKVREFLLTKSGVQIVDLYLGQSGVLTGSMRALQEAKDFADAENRSVEETHLTAQLVGKRKFYEAQAASLKAELASVEAELLRALASSKARDSHFGIQRSRLEASLKKKSQKKGKR